MTRHITLFIRRPRLMGSLLALAALTAPAMGLPALIAPAQAQIVASAAPAVAPVSALYAALEKAETQPSAAMRAETIGAAVDQAFDMEAILKLSIGTLHYSKLTPDEHTQLVKAFQRFTVARYASTFKPGAGVVFTIQPTTAPGPAGKVIVNTTIRGRTDAASNATPINYVMAQTPQGWRITDILLNGNISQTATQRSDFRSIIGQSGAQGLIRTLNKKADGLLHD